MYSQNWQQYLSTLKTDFTKLAKLEFLQPNGSVAFALDNQVANKRSKAFIQEGDITVNLQNGSRRQVNISLANLDGAYDWAANQALRGADTPGWYRLLYSARRFPCGKPGRGF